MARTKKRSGTRSVASSTSAPPEPTFYLDESIDGPTLAAALRARGAAIERRADHFPPGTRDEVWLAQVGERGWVAITRDKNVRFRTIERRALIESRVRAFVFTAGNATREETAAIVAGALEHMKRIIATRPGPFIYHIGRSGKPIKMD
jgi:hypothetical protein